MQNENPAENKYTLISARLKMLRETETTGESRKHMSQDELARALNFSRPTIQRYEQNDPLLDETTLAHIAKYFNTTVAYLTGVTNIKDPNYYYRELEKMIENGVGCDQLEQYEIERLAGIEKLKTLFEMCGYRYETIEDTPQYDFDGVTEPPKYDGPHKITDPRGINDTIYLSNDELERLKDRLGDTVAFECFRIQRGRDKKNGNG